MEWRNAETDCHCQSYFHETTLPELISVNAQILKTIIQNIKKYNKDCCLLIVTNPVDVLTYLAVRYSGFSYDKVFGSGTTLDSARLRYFLGQKLRVHPSSIHAYMLGR